MTVEDAGATLDRLAALGNDEPAPLWITIDPFPAMADVVRPSDPLGYESRAVGASQLAVAFRARRQGGRDHHVLYRGIDSAMALHGRAGGRELGGVRCHLDPRHAAPVAR